jgi:NTE family protein
MTNSALVLAGGGVAGVAWELGVLRGIQDVDPATTERILDAATTFVGTSAGSVVAAQIAGGTPLAELFDSQLPAESAELSVDIDLSEFGAMMVAANTGVSSPEEGRRRWGAIARATDTASPAVRRAVIAARLPVHEWSDRRVLITAIDTDTGELRVFDRDSGVDLVDAVGASCAVPGIWPTVEIEGRHYMDGGMRTIANADLAAGADRVLILVPGSDTSPMGPALTPADLDALAPARIHTVYADADSLAAFGTNPLDPAVARPSALAGREQGRRVASEIAAFWG